MWMTRSPTCEEQETKWMQAIKLIYLEPFSVTIKAPDENFEGIDVLFKILH